MADRLLNQQGVVQAMAVATRGSSALGKCVEEGRGCFLHQPCCCHSHQRVVIAEHLAGPMPGALLQGLITPAGHPATGQEEQSTSPRTVSKQVIPPGYLLTQLFEHCKRHCLSLSMVGHLNGGRETERGLDTVYFQRLLLILATIDVLRMLKGSLSLCSKLIPCIQNTGLLQVSAVAHCLTSEEEVSQQYHSAA